MSEANWGEIAAAKTRAGEAEAAQREAAETLADARDALVAARTDAGAQEQRLASLEKERDAARRRVSPTVAETLRLAVDALDETLQRSAYRWINLGELYGVAGVA